MSTASDLMLRQEFNDNRSHHSVNSSSGVVTAFCCGPKKKAVNSCSGRPAESNCQESTSSRDETCPVPPAVATPTKFFVQPSSHLTSLHIKPIRNTTNNHAPSLFLKTGPETVTRELHSASRRRGAAIIPWPPRSPPRRVQLLLSIRPF